MTIVNPLSTANSVAQPNHVQVTTPEERQVDLRLEQIVRATVVEGGLDRALLEMNHRHYRAQSDIELQTGQKLTLQVLQTHPKLEFRVLRDPLGGRLNQLLPLLTRSYDWAGLVSQLNQQAPQARLPVEMTQVYNQLQQLLQTGAAANSGLTEQIAKLAVQIQQLAGPAGTVISRPPSANLPPSQAYPFAPAPLPAQTQAAQSPPDFAKLTQNLQTHLAQLPKFSGQAVPPAWEAATRELLQPLQQAIYKDQGHSQPSFQARLAAPQLVELQAIVRQIQQQPNLSPQLAADLERLLAQLAAKPQQPMSAAGQQALAAQTSGPSPAAPVPLGAAVERQSAFAPQAPSLTPPGQAAPAVTSLPVAEVIAGLEKLLVQVQGGQSQKQGLPPDLLGRLEGLLDKVRQLPQAAEVTLPRLPELEVIAGQLSQLVQHSALRPEAGQLGFLSQLFGFHLETELLAGKKRAALASLKLSLLQLRGELDGKAEEPLQRLELFQLCKAKLAEEQLQFLPLPLPGLEEGYLLAEKQPKPDEAAEGEPPLQLSLSLRLSSLGNLRVDMLYDKQGLHLRLAGEDKAKMGYLQNCATELKEMLSAVPLQGLSFAADAQIPALQLVERLLPERSGVLDDRV